MIEEFTGEMVYWDENLPLYDYQRDTMPWDVGPDTRVGGCLPGAAQLNEFFVRALTKCEKKPCMSAWRSPSRIFIWPWCHTRHCRLQRLAGR